VLFLQFKHRLEGIFRSIATLGLFAQSHHGYKRQQAIAKHKALGVLHHHQRGRPCQLVASSLVWLQRRCELFVCVVCCVRLLFVAEPAFLLQASGAFPHSLCASPQSPLCRPGWALYSATSLLGMGIQRPLTAYLRSWAPSRRHCLGNDPISFTRPGSPLAGSCCGYKEWVVRR
jgi:hypothetical protein